jgi:hypothetical protein
MEDAWGTTGRDQRARLGKDGESERRPASSAGYTIPPRRHRIPPAPCPRRYRRVTVTTMLLVAVSPPVSVIATRNV